MARALPHGSFPSAWLWCFRIRARNATGGSPSIRIRFIRPFTARVINPVTRLFAGWLPFFAILSHVGRRSGRTYRTPINVFRRGDRYLFALTYGSDVDWVKNVLAAGGCDMQTRGRHIKLVGPELIVDPQLRE